MPIGFSMAMISLSSYKIAMPSLGIRVVLRTSTSLPSGTIERLDEATTSIWSHVGDIERPAGTRWLQAAASEDGALWLLGRSGSPNDVSVATWLPGDAF